MKSKTLKLILWVIALALVASCGGGSSSDSPTPTPTPTPTPNLSQGEIDDQTASNIISAHVDIYNQNVAGRSQSAYNNVTVNCPNGGTARINGSATLGSNNLTTVDLTYTMTNCRETRTNHTFTYTGVMIVKGTFNVSTNFVSETIQSTGNVAMNGTITVTGFNTATVNQTTTFTINRSFSTASGNIGGRSFSY